MVCTHRGPRGRTPQVKLPVGHTPAIDTKTYLYLTQMVVGWCINYAASIGTVEICKAPAGHTHVESAVGTTLYEHEVIVWPGKNLAYALLLCRISAQSLSTQPLDNGAGLARIGLGSTCKQVFYFRLF